MGNRGEENDSEPSSVDSELKRRDFYYDLSTLNFCKKKKKNACRKPRDFLGNPGNLGTLYEIFERFSWNTNTILSTEKPKKYIN